MNFTKYVTYLILQYKLVVIMPVNSDLVNGMRKSQASDEAVIVLPA